MAVDMHPWRFIEELGKVERFSPATAAGSRDGVPAWRSVFTAMMLYAHAEGYHVFGYGRFRNAVKAAYCKADDARYRPLFEDASRAPAFENRMREWYESGMQEEYLYTCLVEAIEDMAKCGLVLYDARADWKLKVDAVVIINGRAAKVEMYGGTREGRAQVVARREETEREAKRNTLESSHFDNAPLARMPSFSIVIAPESVRDVNGVRLFTNDAVNALLRELYDFAGVEQSARRFLT